MCKFETLSLFQPVTNRSIQPNMRYPNQAQREEQGLLDDKTNQRKQQWQGIGVYYIVNRLSGLIAKPVTRHRNIGNKEQEHKEPTVITLNAAHCIIKNSVMVTLNHQNPSRSIV